MKNKAKVGQPLHVQIALGAKPKDVVTSKGISAKTVPCAKGKK
jgi:hypothetical protein